MLISKTIRVLIEMNIDDFDDLVPEGAPTGIEAIQFNRSSVFLKWQPPYPNKTHNGKTSINLNIEVFDNFCCPFFNSKSMACRTFDQLSGFSERC